MKENNLSGSSDLALKSGSAYMMSNILINATSIITAPIFSRLLTTSDYGIVSNFMAWQSIGLIIIGLGLAYTIGNAKIDFPGELNQFIASIQTLSTITGLFFLIFAIIFVSPLSSLMELDKNLVIIIFIYLLLLPSVIYTQEKSKFQLNYKKNITISIFNTVGSIVFCLILIEFIFLKNRYMGRVIGLILPMSLLGAYYYYSILRNGWNLKMKLYWKYALKISIPFIPHTIGMIVLTQLDRIMIIKLIGSSAAGLYSFGFSYASIIALFSNSISQAFQPWLYENYKNNKIEQIKIATNNITLGLSIIMIFLITLGPEAIKILGPKDFWNAKYVIMPIVIGSFFQYLAATYSTIQLYHKKTVFIPIGTILAASINIGLNFFLIPKFGFKGAAFSTLISFLIQALFHMIIYKRITNKIIYDDKYMWTVALSTALFSFFIYMTYDQILLRYFLLIGILILIFLFQKKNIFIIYHHFFNILNINGFKLRK
jgi:O-antigen/teichoic acid export membrane protein